MRSVDGGDQIDDGSDDPIDEWGDIVDDGEDD